MGANLIVTTLAHRRGTQLDWDAGREFVNSASLSLPQEPLHWIEDEEEFRETILAFIDDLEEGLDDDRSSICLLVHGTWVYVIGGTTWGDDPSELYTAANAVGEWIPLLKAIGFLDWTELSDPQPAWPSNEEA